MKRTSIQSGIYLILLAFLFSCSGDKFEGYELTPEGVRYKVHNRSGNALNPQLTDWVTVKMNYRLEDTMLFSSENLEEPLRFSMIEPMFEGDLYEALKLMAVGDSMTFAIVADSFFYKTAFAKKLPPFVEPGDPMYYDVKLTNVTTDEEYKQEIAEEVNNKEKEELQKLNAYLEKNNITIQPEESGLYFIPLEKGTGIRPDTGDMCRVFLEVSILDGELLYSNFEGTPLDVEYGKSFDTKGFMEGVGMLNVGGSARLIVPSNIGVGESGKETVAPYTTIVYEIKLSEIKTVEEVRKERKERAQAKEVEKDRLRDSEHARLKAYLKENSIYTEPLASGLYYIVREEGNGEQVKIGQEIQVHYTVRTIDGKEIYDSYKNGKPVNLVLGRGSVVQAWEEGIAYMNRGGKSTLIAPSKIAYGRNGKSPLIGPYEPLVYEIEVLEEE